MWWNSETQIVMKLKNSKGDKTQKFNCDNSSCGKTQIVLRLKLWQNSSCDQTKNSNCDKSKKTQFVTKQKKTQIVTKP